MTDQTTTDHDVNVIVRATTHDFQKAPDWQDRHHYAMGTDRLATIAAAAGGRIEEWAIPQLMAELAELACVTERGDATVRRLWGEHGYLELTIVEAPGRTAAHYLAVSRLPEYERDIYLDAILDDVLAERDDHRLEVIGEPCPVTAPGLNHQALAAAAVETAVDEQAPGEQQALQLEAVA